MDMDETRTDIYLINTELDLLTTNRHNIPSKRIKEMVSEVKPYTASSNYHWRKRARILMMLLTMIQYERSTTV